MTTLEERIEKLEKKKFGKPRKYKFDLSEFQAEIDALGIRIGYWYDDMLHKVQEFNSLVTKQVKTFHKQVKWELDNMNQLLNGLALNQQDHHIAIIEILKKLKAPKEEIARLEQWAKRNFCEDPKDFTKNHFE